MAVSMALCAQELSKMKYRPDSNVTRTASTRGHLVCTCDTSSTWQNCCQNGPQNIHRPERALRMLSRRILPETNWCQTGPSITPNYRSGYSRCQDGPLTLARTGGVGAPPPPPLRFFADSEKTAARSAAEFWGILWGKPCATFGKKNWPGHITELWRHKRNNLRQFY